jgi:hypothetical protein
LGSPNTKQWRGCHATELQVNSLGPVKTLRRNE